MKKLENYKPGDILLITTRTRNGEEKRGAIVTVINYGGNGLVTFTGHHIEGMMETGSGAFDPATVGTKPFGFYCAVEKVGHVAPWTNSFHQPRPGDRSYDCMC